MMPFRQLSQYRRFVTASAFVLIFTAFVSSCEAQSVSKITAGQVLRAIVGEFVGIDGYWFTSASAADALGNPKFGSNAHFYVRPKHIHGMEFTGGLELVGVSDNWFPFTSTQNYFSLTGFSARLSGIRGRVGRVTPFVTAGYFVGNVHSDRMGFDTTSIVPSMAVGAEWKIHRYVTMTAQYRLTPVITGIDTSGFNVSLKLF